LGDRRKGIQTVKKSLAPAKPKGSSGSLLGTGLLWRDLWKNRHVKQKLE